MRHVLTLSLASLLSVMLHAQDPGTAPAGQSLQAGFEDGFFIRSADGRYALDVNGRAQFDADWNGSERVPESDFFVRRLRLEFSGRFPGGVRFHYEPNLLPEGLEVEEGWIGLDVFGGNARWMFGRMKAPFLLEERNPQGNVDLPRFSILHQFAPAEDHGVFFYGRTASGRFGYDLAAYNGTGDSDTNSSKDVAARFTFRPIEGEHFQVGVAATHGRQNAAVGEDAIENEARLPVLRFDDALRLDGARTRLGFETYWHRGPWFAQAEWAHVEQDMSLGTGAREVAFDGFYALVSRVLTGEDKSFGATQPTQPFDFEHGAGRGAWIVAARYSELACDDVLASAGFVEPGTFTEDIRTLSLGLDWVPTENTIARLAWLHSWYSDDVQLDRGADDTEDAVVLEMQLNF